MTPYSQSTRSRLRHRTIPPSQHEQAWVECRLRETVELGDHSVFVGEVTEARVITEPEGRPDEATLWLRDLGERLFYGG